MLQKDPFLNSQSVEVCGEKLLLLPEKAIYWESRKLLLIADLHLGKSAHFRKNGIAVPRAVEAKNWDTLSALFQKIQPQRVNFLGDLFHSTYNKEWEAFSELIHSFLTIQFELTLGNHDILPDEFYQQANLSVFSSLEEGPFLLSHEPQQSETHYNLAGHIHPGVLLKGKGIQRQRLACFYFGKNQGLLPAFGSFTGLATIPVKEGDLVFAVVENEVIQL